MTEKSLSDIKQKQEWFNQNYRDILKRIDLAVADVGKAREDIILLAATKTVPTEVINYAIENGIKYIGENRVQEFLSKKDQLTPNVHRHFIGHLQTNKVKDIINEVEMIESVHSLKLAAEISRLSQKNSKVTDILVEVNIGNEESKSGFLPEELEPAITEISKMPNILVKGLMTIPPICENIAQTRQYFEKMHKLFIDIGTKNMDNVSMVYLSMGMSSDFDEAIRCGANIVRIGTSLFGQRIYK